MSTKNSLPGAKGWGWRLVRSKKFVVHPVAKNTHPRDPCFLIKQSALNIRMVRPRAIGLHDPFSIGSKVEPWACSQSCWTVITFRSQGPSMCMHSSEIVFSNARRSIQTWDSQKILAALYRCIQDLYNTCVRTCQTLCVCVWWRMVWQPLRHMAWLS